MTAIDIGIGILAAGACLAVLRLAVEADRSWPSFYRIFLLLFFTVFSVVLWMHKPPADTRLLWICLAMTAVAVAVGFISPPPPKNRRETKNLLDRIETERTLERFFASDIGRLFWPILAILVFSAWVRIWMLVKDAFLLQS